MSEAEGTFRKVETSNEPMYGARAMLVCGHAEVEQHAIRLLLNRMGREDLPVISVGNDDGEQTLLDLAARPGGSGLGEPSDMERTIVLSGITQNELHEVMPAYRTLELPRTLWAVMTPSSEKWTIRALIEELGAERQALREAAQQSKGPGNGE